MLIEPSHTYTLHETSVIQPLSYIDTQSTPAATDTAIELQKLQEQIALLEQQLGPNTYVLTTVLGCVQRALYYSERARTVGNEKSVIPNATTSQRLADRELENAALPVASYFGNFEHGQQWVKDYAETSMAINALSHSVHRSTTS